MLGTERKDFTGRCSSLRLCPTVNNIDIMHVCMYFVCVTCWWIKDFEYKVCTTSSWMSHWCAHPDMTEPQCSERQRTTIIQDLQSILQTEGITPQQPHPARVPVLTKNRIEFPFFCLLCDFCLERSMNFRGGAIQLSKRKCTPAHKICLQYALNTSTF